MTGTWEFHVTFVDGPRQGLIETRQVELLPSGALVMLGSGGAAGRWSMTGTTAISFAFHEVILDDDGTPQLVIHVTGQGRVDPQGDAFDASATGEVYILDARLTATNRSEVRATR